MRKKIKHQSIPEALADELERAIRRGRWTKRLPGYRELAEEYSVSRRSAVEAMTVLEMRGVLHPPEPGKRRRIRVRRTKGRGVENTSLLVVSCERSRISSDDFDLLNSHVNHWLGRGGHVRHALVDMTRSRSCVQTVARWLENHKPGAFLVTHGPSAWLKAMADTGLPVYCVGGEVGGIMDRGCGCGHELKDTLGQVMGELRRRGHTRVLFPVRAGWETMEKDVRGKFLELFGDLYPEEELQRFIVRFSEKTPESWMAGWHRHVSSLRPTAVICDKEADLLSLYGYCSSRGLRIPQDLSVVSLVSGWTTDWIWPHPTLLRFPYKKAERHFQQWVRSSMTLRGFRILLMEWVEGESLRPIPLANATAGNH